MRRLLTSVVLLVLAAPAAAVDIPMPRWTLGAMAVGRDTPYRDYDNRWLALPLVRFEGERLNVRGTRASFQLTEAQGFSTQAIVQAHLEGYDPSRSPFLDGMHDRDWSLDAGLGATWTNPRVGQFSLSAVTDALGRHEGQEVQLGYSVAFNAGAWLVAPTLNLRWKSDDMVDYYYGVRDDEATALRPAYRPGSALVPALSVVVMRPVSARWSLYGQLVHSRLPSSVTDSPIVEKSGTTFLAIGLGYSPE